MGKDKIRERFSIENIFDFFQKKNCNDFGC